MEFKHLQSFATVVRCGSFSRAADELFISQPTISLHIRQLEDELHTKLIVRTTKSLEVTPKGREVFDYAVNILSLRERLVENCSIESHRVIQLGASTIPSAYILPEVLPGYVRERPDVCFVIDQGDSQQMIQRLTEGVLDLALIGMKPDDSSITCIPFYTDSSVIITPVNERYLAMKERGDAALRELLREPIILREEGSGSRKTAAKILNHLGIHERDLNVCARLNDPEAIKNLVAGGFGISIISDKAARGDRDANRLLTFEFPASICHRKLYAAYRKDFVLKSFAKDFVKYLTRFYRS